MADINNFAEISENFDTIKTLLNSIRAQGILNTSDVDKLLAGINSKLEKLNTEEDIDLIKIFLSELKQNLDERHSVLLSKFGAIESLFSNLLKNSSETLKSSEVKELFDIVATNLSVFSREVVSQKETLSDITLRLDAMRSDDSQKRDIIKSIVPLKTDLERLNNGFDSIVLNLNENFKNLVRTLSEIDQSESINNFEKELNDISNSSNTILSALQMLDKKSVQIEDAMKNLATQEDIADAKRSIADLTAKNHELVNSVELLSEKYYKIDNLAEKIDASVSIIAGLKSLFEEQDEQSAKVILDRLAILEAQIGEIASDSKFEDFKIKLETILNDITSDTKSLQEALSTSSEELQRINANIKALDISTGFQSVITNLHKTELDLKNHVETSSDKVSQLVDVGITRTINEISSNAEALSSKIKETSSELTSLCEKSFSEVTENISGLRNVVAQIDENNVSANNAIFSNITDRLTIFENSLKTSLEKQEEYVANSSNQVVEEITNIKNLSGVIDYKIDSSVIEISNTKREFEELKKSVDNVLALDFVTAVKDLRVDLYASKQDLTTAVENSSTELREKFTNDLFGKYELLISKLDNVEDELKQVQSSALTGLKSILDNISSSIVDIISYVSVRNENASGNLDVRLADFTEAIKNYNLDYIENVRDIVDVIRVQVENNLTEMEKDTAKHIETINSAISKNTEAIRDEIKYSYNKLLEVQDSFNEVKENIGLSNQAVTSNYENILSGTESLRQDFEVKLTTLKNALLESVSEFKQDFTCENADKISELKFVSENLHSKGVQNAVDLKNELKQELTLVLDSLKLNVKGLSEQLSGTILNIEGANKEVISYIKNEFCTVVDSSIEAIRSNLCDFSDEMSEKVSTVSSGFSSLENSVNNLATTTTTSLSSTLAQILDNFVAMKALINTLNEKSSIDLAQNVDKIINDFASLRETVNNVDANIDEDLTHQLSIIENGFESLASRVSELLADNNQKLSERIDSGLSQISEQMSDSLAEKLEGYKLQIEKLFESLQNKTNLQANFIKQQAEGLNTVLDDTLNKQNKAYALQIEEISSKLKSVLEENIELSAQDYDSLKKEFNNLSLKLAEENKDFALNLKAQLDDVIKYVDSGLDISAQETGAKFDEIVSNINNATGMVTELNSDVQSRVGHIQETISTLRESIISSMDGKTLVLINKLDEFLADLIMKSNELSTSSVANLNTSLEEKALIIVKKLDEIFSDVIAKNSEINSSAVLNITSSINDNSENLINKLEDVFADIVIKNRDINSSAVTNITSAMDERADIIINKLEELIKNLTANNDEIKSSLNTSIISAVDGKTLLIINRLDDLLRDIITKNNDIHSSLLSTITSENEDIKSVLSEENKNISELLANQTNTVLTRQNEISRELLENVSEISDSFASGAADVINSVKTVVDVNVENLDKSIEEKFNLVQAILDNTLKEQQNSIISQEKEIFNELKSVYGGVTKQLSVINTLITDNLGQDIENLYERIQKLIEELSLNNITSINNSTTDLIEELHIQSSDLKGLFSSLNERLDKDEISQMNIFQSQLKEVINTFNTLIEEAKTVTKQEVSSISETLIGNSKALMEEVEQSIEEKVNSILAASADISAGELQSMEVFADRILKQVEVGNQSTSECKNIITDLINKNLETLSDNIEKETDFIVKDLTEQFNTLKDFQKDELSKMTIHIEGSVDDYIYNHINDLKSYLDVKTDSSIINHKLDNLKTDIDASVDNVLENISQLITAGADNKAANEVLITSMSDKINNKIETFIKENVSEKFEERFNLLDKKFIETLVDKYEEVKLISIQYNNAFDTIQSSIQGLIAGFAEAKDDLSSKVESIVNGINSSIDELGRSFADLKAQILNKSFDEAFQASLNNQISGIEALVNEQLGYLNDISELCCNNLPELTEMNTLVKYGIQQSIADLTSKVENQDTAIEKELTNLKSDIITQILNIFNQISFVAEQEEILDFIQEKHSDLITILSHIVTSVDTVASVDSKVNSIKDEISSINDKIASIISSDGDIDYIYSLQDLESDIANLRLVLNEMKSDNKSKEFEELISSTNDIYKLVEGIKAELPKFEAEEFKRDFDSLSEDIVSISTRTNKLILASDESYKMLQENLQDFKLVINDLDERTRNFAHDAGIDRIDDKLGSISSMIHSGAKTNQVFNQVFEYLAEWVDKAGEQISTISDKVETLDDIGQIKVMLEDLKAEAEDNTDSVELIEALSNVFDKQAKRISSLEAKLDRVIVETTISNKNNKIDLSPFEDTLNKFLVAIDDKMAQQQSKIDSLEEKLEEVVSKIDPKDTAQLTKKVGGMDRQIAKLNKSIEKIASHVVEK